MTPVGLPHSEISGSMRACRSPKHIAACHVLHRLSVPRHPPSTLSNLTIKCLDLMRSAVPRRTLRRVSASLYLPIFNCQRNACGREDQRWAQSRIVRTACLPDGHGFEVAAAEDGGKVGGADRDRTDDPLLAKQVLSQLSYSPGGPPSSGGIES